MNANIKFTCINRSGSDIEKLLVIDKLTESYIIINNLKNKGFSESEFLLKDIYDRNFNLRFYDISNTTIEVENYNKVSDNYLGNIFISISKGLEVSYCNTQEGSSSELEVYIDNINILNG